MSNSVISNQKANKTEGTAETSVEPDLDKLLADVKPLDLLTIGWPDEYKLAIEAQINAVEALNSAAFMRLVSGLQSHGAVSALRESVSDEVVYAVLRRHGILKASLYERVEEALENIRPMLKSHGGNVELINVEPPRVDVRFLGACDGCPASALTFYSGVKKVIQENVPEITEIKQLKGLSLSAKPNDDTVHFTSPFATYQKDSWIDALSFNDISDGETKFIELEKHSVLLSRFEDSISCFENACAHMGLAMDGGEIRDGILTCPYHGFRYSLNSGECLTAPEVQLQPHGVRVVGNNIQINFTG